MTIVHRFYAMGSECAIHLSAETESHERIKKIAPAAEAEIRRLEYKYSRYRADSELYHINQSAKLGESVEIDRETADLIRYAKACYEKSDGALDVTSGLLRAAWDFSKAQTPDQAAIDDLLPRIGLDKVKLSNGVVSFARPGMELDFGGLAKEYAVDRAAEVCIEQGALHGFVDLGGDISIVGAQPDGAPWEIGIRHPRKLDSVISKVSLSDGAIATSGDYERFIDVDGRRYCHILDPRTGWPAEGISSVTVIADRCLVAGSLATIAFLKSSEGEPWLRSLGVRYLVVDRHGSCKGTEPVLTQAL